MNKKEKPYDLVLLSQIIDWLQSETILCVKLLKQTQKEKNTDKEKFIEMRLTELANRLIMCDKEMVREGLVK